MDTEFFKAAVLDAIIPDNTTAELAQLLVHDVDLADDPNRLLPIKERDLLFFGVLSLLHLGILSYSLID